MSVHQLTSQNFSLLKRGQKKFLNINLPGAVLCFFKMDGCPGCKTFEPTFYQLASQENNISYGVINLSSSREVVTMSRQSTTPIPSVPFLLLFVNGGPHAKYNGKKSLLPLKSFISKALQHVPPTTQGFMPNTGNYIPNQMAPMSGHPGYHPGAPGVHGAQQPKAWMPDVGNPPNMKGKLKGDVKSHYSYLDETEDEPEDKLLLPEQVTPYNIPWEVSYKKLSNLMD